MFCYKKYSLELKEPFGTAHGVRERTDGVLVAVSKNGLVGYGEVFMPPYYPEDQKSMTSFYEKVDPEALLEPNTIGESLEILDGFAPGNRGAKSALDIALHDLHGKLRSESYLSLYPGFEGIDLLQPSETSFTIGTAEVGEMVEKAQRADEFKTLKIKLNGENDVEVIRKISEAAKGKKLFVDANQGWKDLDSAIETAKAIVDLGVSLIEQPFPTSRLDDVKELGRAVDVPLIADEDLQTLDQLRDLAASYDGVNIKIMKAGGIRPAIRLFARAKRLGMKVLLGCMTESSIGISAAAKLSAAVNWCDLDGNLLIKNDTCEGVRTKDGLLINSQEAGIGITDDSRLRKFFEL